MMHSFNSVMTRWFSTSGRKVHSHFIYCENRSNATGFPSEPEVNTAVMTLVAVESLANE